MEIPSFLAALASLLPLNSKQTPILMQLDTNPAVIPGSGTLTAGLTLPGDCDLQIDDWCFVSSDTNYPTASGFRVAIMYGGGDFSLNYPANNPVRGEMLFGTAQRPGRIGYQPWNIATYGNRGLLSFQFSNLGTTSCTLEICLRGHRTSR